MTFEKEESFMKKKLLAVFLSAALAAAMLAGCGSSSGAPAESDATEKSTEAGGTLESSGEKMVYGALSILNISEEEYRDMNLSRTKVRRIMTDSDKPLKDTEVIFYDNLDAMQMALEAGEIEFMELPRCTADYLAANNDKMQIRGGMGDPEEMEEEELEEEELELLDQLSSTGFAFMMREDSKKLRDEFDKALDDMKEDGTLVKLIKENITDVVNGKEPKAVDLDGKGDETIKVAVTGDLPPMDYVAADGSFAGFNTAMLAEIGNRLNKKIELKQVDSAARALSLSSNEVDVVFWTRVSAGKADEDAMEEGQEEILSEEDQEKRKEVGEALSEGGSQKKRERMDMPEGTIVTDAYYVDRLVPVELKK